MCLCNFYRIPKYFNIRKLHDIIILVIVMNQKFQPNQIVKGIVSGITEYGIFLNFEEGFSGMIHISEISDQFVKNITDYAQIGEILTCKILDLNYYSKKLRLSIKELAPSLQTKPLFDQGFIELNNHLSFWINQKMKEIKQKNAKNN